jgi:hypothetical protein
LTTSDERGSLDKMADGGLPRDGDQVQDVVARDPRVEAILNHPDDYFDRARYRAWMEAGRDVLSELDRRQSRRRNGSPTGGRLEARLADLSEPQPPA